MTSKTKDNCGNSDEMVESGVLYGVYGLAVVLAVVVLVVVAVLFYRMRDKMERQLDEKMALLRKEITLEVIKYYDSLVESSLR